MKILKNILAFIGIAILTAVIAALAIAAFVYISSDRILMGPGYLAFLAIISPTLFLYYRYRRMEQKQPSSSTWLLWVPSLLILIALGRVADEHFGEAFLYFLAGEGYRKPLTSEEKYQNMKEEYTYDYPKPYWAPEVCDCINNIKAPAALFDPELQALCEKHANELTQSEKKERLREAYNNGCLRASELE